MSLISWTLRSGSEHKRIYNFSLSIPLSIQKCMNQLDFEKKNYTTPPCYPHLLLYHLVIERPTPNPALGRLKGKY